MWGNMSSHFIHIEPSHITLKRARPIRIYELTVLILHITGTHGIQLGSADIIQTLSLHGRFEGHCGNTTGSGVSLQNSGSPIASDAVPRKAICLCPINELKRVRVRSTRARIRLSGHFRDMGRAPKQQAKLASHISTCRQAQQEYVYPVSFEFHKFWYQLQIIVVLRARGARDILSISSLWWPTWS